MRNTLGPGIAFLLILLISLFIWATVSYQGDEGGILTETAEQGVRTLEDLSELNKGLTESPD